MKRLTCFLFLLALLLFTACSDDDGRGFETQRMPVRLSVMTDEGKMVRTPADPGDADEYILPRVAYIFVVAEYKESGVTKTVVVTPGDDTANGKLALTGNWEPRLGEEHIYDYQENIYVSLPRNLQAARVYAVVGTREVKFASTLDFDALTEAELINLKFEANGTGINATSERNEFLKNLYSSPYNLGTNDAGVYYADPIEEANRATQYYGRVLEAGTAVPHVSLVLYHVAARVDVKWNVAEDARWCAAAGAGNALTYLQVRDLQKTGYVFRPTENVKGGSTYHEVLHNTTGTDVSSAWSGRKAVYTIQQYASADGGLTTYFPFLLRMGVNGDAIADYPAAGSVYEDGKVYGRAHQADQAFTPDAIFTSWIAVNLNINTYLKYDAAGNVLSNYIIGDGVTTR